VSRLGHGGMILIAIFACDPYRPADVYHPWALLSMFTDFQVGVQLERPGAGWRRGAISRRESVHHGRCALHGGVSCANFLPWLRIVGKKENRVHFRIRECRQGFPGSCAKVLKLEKKKPRREVCCQTFFWPYRARRFSFPKTNFRLIFANV